MLVRLMELIKADELVKHYAIDYADIVYVHGRKRA